MKRSFILPDKTTVYYDELSDGKVRLTGIIRDGMVRSSSEQTFNSVSELRQYCANHNWSKY